MFLAYLINVWRLWVWISSIIRFGVVSIVLGKLSIRHFFGITMLHMCAVKFIFISGIVYVYFYLNLK